MIFPIENHDHDGINSKPVNPKNFLPPPVYSSIPDIKNAPNQFIYINGATKRLYFKYQTTLLYTNLT